MKKKLFLLVALCMILTSCGGAKPQDKEPSSPSETAKENTEVSMDKPVVYTSFYPIYNLASQIAGDKMEVKSFTNLKTESHGWEPSAKEIAELSNSKLIFINGAGMEEWLDSVKSSTDIEIVDTTEEVTKLEPGHTHDHDHEHEEVADEHDHEHEHEEVADEHEHEHEHEEVADEHEHEHEHEHNHGMYDPHTWLSPKNAIIQAKAIAEKLSEVDPENSEYYMSNFKAMEDELNGIIKEYEEKFSKTEKKYFFVNHAAFNYMAHDFGLEQKALTGITSTDEAGTQKLKEAIDIAKELNINTVFYEQGGSDKSAKTLANEINAKTETLDNMEFATDEDLEAGKTYQEIIKENLEKVYQSMI